jgi:osmoprotectant transport system ATP-binding protein
VFVGPSGCGKTTTLKMINRIIEPTSGSIVVDGVAATEVPAHELRRDIGYVIQRVGLFPHRTIEQNIATVPRLLGWEQDRTDARVDELLELMDLDRAMKTRYPAELSGGQQQRVGVARALAADPPVLLMDEPYGAVDPLVRSRLQDQLLELQAELHKTIVFVTHDIDEAIKLGDRIAILNVGGILAQYDVPAAILAHPASEFVASFLGEERSSQAAVADAGGRGGPGARPGGGGQRRRSRRPSGSPREEGTDWVGVLDGHRLRGWVWVSELDPARRSGRHRPRLPGVDPGVGVAAHRGGRDRQHPQPGGGRLRRRPLRRDAVHRGGQPRAVPVTAATVWSAISPLLAQSERPLFEWSWVTRNASSIWDATVEHLYLTGMAVGIGLLVSLAWRSSRPAAAVVVRADHRRRRAALHDPVAGGVRAAGAVHRPDGDDGDHRADLVHDPDPGPQRRDRHRRGPAGGGRGGQGDGLPAGPAVLRDRAAAGVAGDHRRGADRGGHGDRAGDRDRAAGARGLGQFILRGFRVLPPYPTQIIVGTVLSVVLAVVVDLGLLALERALTPWSRRKVTV